MARHRWHIHLLQAIENEFGEPEVPGEHSIPASEAVCQYLEGLGYIDSTVKMCFEPNSGNDTGPLAYELYLFAKWLDGNGKIKTES